jgi:hypothetical protein
MDPICEVAGFPRKYQMLAATNTTKKMATAATQYLRLEAGAVVADSAADEPDPTPLVKAEPRFAAETGPESAGAGGTAEAEGAAVIGTEPEGGAVIAEALALTAELLPESSSRFKRFRSARISEAT